MNKEEFIGKLQLVYVGDKRAIEEIISEYDRLNNLIIEYEDKGYDIAQERADFLLEIDRLKDLCNKYEKEHNTAFKLWTQKIEEMPDFEERMKSKKEVIRLNNIINELEKYLIEHIDEYREMEQDAMFEFGLVLDKLKALKENNK